MTPHQAARHKKYEENIFRSRLQGIINLHLIF